jgi:two-component system cell cycle response regulator DivK
MGPVSKVLVAEDNPLNFELVLDVLEGGGHEVMWAQDGEEAVRLARATDFDIMLVDLHMPRLDGLGVVRLLRADSRFATLRIIALTADAMPGVREELLAAGADAYLTKPLDVGGLISAVELPHAS